MTRRVLANWMLVAGLVASAVAPARSAEISTLEGSWTLEGAYEIRADGTRTTNFGEHPNGLLTVDHAGRYNLQIFKIGRPLFASGDKARGTLQEYSAASLGSSTHFGHVAIDQAKQQLIFDIEGASFPNWEGKRQVRDFNYEKGLLSYSVPASASGNGTIAYSIWRRAADAPSKP